MTVYNPTRWEGEVIADVAAVLGSGAVGTLGGALTAGLFGRRKSRADAAAVLTQAAAAMVAPLSQQLAEVTRRLEEYQRRDRERESRRMVLAVRHEQWDNEVRESLRELGVEVPTPPPLDVIA